MAKSKKKRILISQAEPVNKSAYEVLGSRFGAEVTFRPFFKAEPLTSREFRAQRINISEYTAVVFTSRNAIDAFFSLCEQLRVTVPDTMKYFCSSEAVAMYLQKYIVLRRRKVFFGNGKTDSIVGQIGQKHCGEKFLIATSGASNNDSLSEAFADAGLSFTTAVFLKPVSQDLRDINPSDYDLMVFYNPADIRSLKENFPDFNPDGIRFMTYGKHIVQAMEEAGLPIAVKAPTPEAPSVAKALELYLQDNP